ncbi:c-type cytochrome [Kordiimonas marina]|uniref:c-type cytochrome n=1 Tax=Kordiimonas marina TaxID=2872312 RepID=UPI001FF17AF6|nr:c-type cytochrome [Kordiimonas marina]MCJ9427865.1 c-type cytochrome [Kordiimonas marina]
MLETTPIANRARSLVRAARPPLLAVLFLGAAAATFLATGSFTAARADSAPEATAWNPPDIDSLPDNEWGRTVRYGRDLIEHTASLIGPEVKDPSHRFSGNNLNCQNCHLQAGTQKFGNPYVGVYADFPSYRKRSGSVGTMEDRVQGCMQRSMNGKPLPAKSRELVSIVSYLKFLSTGQAIGAPRVGKGSGKMPELTRAADPVKGHEVYNNICAACHGADGQGQRVGEVGDGQGYQFPPLWGPDSYNDGAGMNRLITAANFIHSNMPFGTTYDEPALSVEDAWDVAAYIDSQPRPHKAHIERDFPNRLEKKIDSAFGPYADHFSEKQHKYGPYAPIRAEIKKLKQQAKK